MDSRRQAASEGVRLPELSRRAVLAGTSAVALPASKSALPRSAVSPPASDDGAKPYRRWLSLNARIERLQTRWAKLESWLVREHSWFQLTPAEQQALPWAKELRDIDGCLDLLFVQREAIQATLPAQGSTTLEAVIVKLAVVERLVGPDDDREAYALIVGARQDLMAMARQLPHRCGRSEAGASDIKVG